MLQNALKGVIMESVRFPETSYLSTPTVIIMSPKFFDIFVLVCGTWLEGWMGSSVKSDISRSAWSSSNKLNT